MSKEGILARVSNYAIVQSGKKAAIDATFVAKKLARSTGNAAWIAGSTFLILFVPLIIAMDREQQLTELEMQQASLLGTPSFAAASASASPAPPAP
ncbi:mitochondrial import receptor subunit TOM9-2-like [Aristolochia californica]|uniref:mitochondrial import receptor subunit TOM9-2-like n=1 Tax=Aristolochia californica TaxID=171875 RepID=UPI0035DEF0B3